MPQKFISTDGFDATLPESFESEEDWKCALMCKYGDDAIKIIEAIESKPDSESIT